MLVLESSMIKCSILGRIQLLLGNAQPHPFGFELPLGQSILLLCQVLILLMQFWRLRQKLRHDLACSWACAASS